MHVRTCIPKWLLKIATPTASVRTYLTNLHGRTDVPCAEAAEYVQVDVVGQLLLKYVEAVGSN